MRERFGFFYASVNGTYVLYQVGTNTGSGNKVFFTLIWSAHTLELGYFACSLISGFNDNASTLICGQPCGWEILNLIWSLQKFNSLRLISFGYRDTGYQTDIVRNKIINEVKVQHDLFNSQLYFWVIPWLMDCDWSSPPRCILCLWGTLQFLFLWSPFLLIEATRR